MLLIADKKELYFLSSNSYSVVLGSWLISICLQYSTCATQKNEQSKISHNIIYITFFF